MTEQEEELQRLRRDLYRPDPPPGTRERYETLRVQLDARRPPALDSRPAARPDPEHRPEPAAEPVPAAPAPSRARRLALGGLAVVVAGGVAAFALLTPGQRGSAAPLGPALTGGDRARLEQAFAPAESPWGPPSAGATVVDVLRRADLPQLRVWDGRAAIGWVQRGTGPQHREFGAGRPARLTEEPLSIVVRCSSDAVYTWTLRGTAPGSDVVHVLATGDADRCDAATVATARLPAGSRVTAFDLRVPRDVAWTMAVVVPERD